MMIKILIIEDNEDLRDNTADILKLAKYNVSTAENGKIGVEIAKKLHPDIILCDIMMPELDGYEVLEDLSKNNQTAKIPFIFVTSKAEKADMRKGMNLGADDYLTKPFNEKELLEAIESRFKKHNFLKKEFSRTIAGVSQFIDEASKFMDTDLLSKNYKPQHYKNREWIFTEGSTANSLFFIERGTVKTYRITEKGKEFITGIHGSGDFIGQLSLLTEKRTYSESALVLEDTEIYKIPKTDFTTLLHSNKEVSSKFLSLISNNLIEMEERVVNIAFCSVRHRVAKVLLDLQHKGILTNKENDGIAIFRDDLAGLIGTATETAIRMLTEFKEEGLITIGTNKKIIIEDKKALENIVDSY